MEDQGGRMTTSSKKILFITPGAQSFGGNILLLNFLRWYKRNGGRDFVTLYGHPGDLSDDFAALSPTYRYYASEASSSFSRKAAGKLANRMELRRAFIKSKIKRDNIGLIYSNAVTNGRMLSMFDRLDVPVISHCHELESLILRTGLEDFESLKDRTSHFVAVSRAVKENLIGNHDIADDQISLIHAFTPIEDQPKTRPRDAILSELDLPSNSFIVGGSGTLNWRKAPELFVELARSVKTKEPDAPIYFIWIGGFNKNDFRIFELMYDAVRCGVEKSLRFLEHRKNPLDYFAAIDVFAMVSREDPYPLVCLEAASLGKPIICFADAGGMPEFVEEDCGYVVPYLDLDSFAAKILELSSDRVKGNNFGENASRKVRARHDIEVAAPRVVEIIERFFRP
jgi:glycosyltransferase involved in cell wall biosynthesis